MPVTFDKDDDILSSPSDDEGRRRRVDDIDVDDGIRLADYIRPPSKNSTGEKPYDAEEAVQVEYFANEKSFKSRLQLYFIKNRRSSFRIRAFNVFLKLLSCALYVLRVEMDSDECIGGACKANVTKDNLEIDKAAYLVGERGQYTWSNLLWVRREPWLYWVQVFVAIVSLVEGLILMYINYKVFHSVLGYILQSLVSWEVVLESLTSVPFVITVSDRVVSGRILYVKIFFPSLRQAFIPVFLNCWLARFQLATMLNDYNRVMQKNQSAMFRQILLLIATLGCLVFTSTCGIQHLQRVGRLVMTLFQSFYFIIVTLSTVGFGEFYPDYWLSQLWVIGIIITAFLVLPTQLERLAYSWLERSRSGAQYSTYRAKSEKHVVLTVTHLNSEQIMDFMNEFYAHPKLQDYYVLLLSPNEMDQAMRLLLQVPLWSDQVIFIKGTALKDSDLARARVDQAEACFIVANRTQSDKTLADQHTILRSWAVKDYAPKCPQYVQLFRPENKMHVKHADTVVCEDEFKYALLASNCICPGISTFITLLLHTSRGQEGQHSSEPWHSLYGKHSGNEIYHIRLGSSKFFGEYEGKSFTYASFHAHRKYGVSLVGIQKDRAGSTIQLNPGSRHILRATDTCYYMSITKEELSAFLPQQSAALSRKDRIASSIAGIGTVALELQTNDAGGGHAKKDNKAATSTVSSNNGAADGGNSKSWLKPSARRKTSGKEEKAMEEGETDVMTAAEEKHALEIQQPCRKPSIASIPDKDEEYELQSDNDNELNRAVQSRQSLGATIDEDDDDICPSCGLLCVEDEYRKGFPPVTPYIGTSATLCYLLKVQKHLCCLQLAQICEHCHYTTAKDYNWKSKAIILVADHASNGLYNFIIPLRAHYRLAHELSPIVLLLEQIPDQPFLDAISWFPMIYWMSGNIESMDNLLRAGIVYANQVIVVNKEGAGAGVDGYNDEYMADCNTVVTVQTMFRLFPSIHFIAELSHSSNMRFMQFNAKDLYALHQSKIEKKEKSRGSHIAYMFRLPFAAGYVFSANMLDTLLYQTMVKDYLVQFVRLLLGIDQAMGSGYLASIKITEEDMWIRTYGRLYQKLCAGDADIPIGIYRTKRMDDSSAVSTQHIWRSRILRRLSFSHRRHQQQQQQHHENTLQAPPLPEKRPVARPRSLKNKSSSDRLLKVNCSDASLENEGHGGDDSPTGLADSFERKFSCKYLVSERHEIGNLIRCRMNNLGLPSEDYNYARSKRGTISFVIINPSYDLPLEPGDIVYVIKPNIPVSARPKKTMNPRSVLRRSYKRAKSPKTSRKSTPEPTEPPIPSPSTNNNNNGDRAASKMEDEELRQQKVSAVNENLYSGINRKNAAVAALRSKSPSMVQSSLPSFTVTEASPATTPRGVPSEGNYPAIDGNESSDEFDGCDF